MTSLPLTSPGKSPKRAPTNAAKTPFKPHPLPTRSFPCARTPSPDGTSTHFTPISREEINILISRLKKLEKYTLQASQLLRTGLLDLENRILFLEGRPVQENPYQPRKELEGPWDRNWPDYEIKDLEEEGGEEKGKEIKKLERSNTRLPARSRTPTQRDHSPDRQLALEEYRSYEGLGDGLSNSEYTGDGQSSEYSQPNDSYEDITAPTPARLSNRDRFDTSDSFENPSSFDGHDSHNYQDSHNNLRTITPNDSLSRPTDRPRHPLPLNRSQTFDGPYYTPTTSTNSNSETISRPTPIQKKSMTWGDVLPNPFLSSETQDVGLRPLPPIHTRDTHTRDTSNLQRSHTLMPGSHLPTARAAERFEDVELGRSRTVMSRDRGGDRLQEDGEGGEGGGRMMQEPAERTSQTWFGMFKGMVGAPQEDEEKRFVKPGDIEDV